MRPNEEEDLFPATSIPPTSITEVQPNLEPTSEAGPTSVPVLPTAPYPPHQGYASYYPYAQQPWRAHPSYLPYARPARWDSGYASGRQSPPTYSASYPSTYSGGYGPHGPNPYGQPYPYAYRPPLPRYYSAPATSTPHQASAPFPPSAPQDHPPGPKGSTMNSNQLEISEDVSQPQRSPPHPLHNLLGMLPTEDHTRHVHLLNQMRESKMYLPYAPHVTDPTEYRLMALRDHASSMEDVAGRLQSATKEREKIMQERLTRAYERPEFEASERRRSSSSSSGRKNNKKIAFDERDTRGSSSRYREDLTAGMKRTERGPSSSSSSSRYPSSLSNGGTHPPPVPSIVTRRSSKLQSESQGPSTLNSKCIDGDEESEEGD